jgi:PPOX class probable F420-dependent enzyme
MPGDLALVRHLALEAGNLAVLATSRADGTVHASLVNAGVIDDPVTGDPSVGVVVSANAVKLGLLRRAPLATAIFHAGFRWVAVEGQARIVGPEELPDGVAPQSVASLLRAVFVAAGGTHEDWTEFDRVMAAERRAAVFVTADRITTNP